MKKAISCIMISTLLFVAACTSQSTIATLANALGNYGAAVAALENDPTLAAKLKVDTAAAVSGILAWKSGTASQSVLEALNLVMDDLNLVPVTGIDAQLIALSLATAESIITAIEAESPPAVAARMGVPHRQVYYTGKLPKDAAQFKKAWNKIANTDPKLKSVVMP